MSLAINATTSSGIILATDSRQSYRNQKGQARIGSDNASKLFQLSRRVGVAITGIAFLPEGGVLKNVSNFIEEFKRKEEVEKMKVKEITERLHRFFNEKYDYRKPLEQLKTVIIKDLEKQGCKITEDFKEEKKGFLKFKFQDPSGKEHPRVVGLERISLLIAGFNHDDSHEVYGCNIPGEIIKKRDSAQKGQEYGASWIGQVDVTSRIVLGWDGRILTLPFVQNAISKSNQQEIERQLRGLEYKISWGTMTLQDAIDFCVLAIKTTEAIQRFSDGVKMNPGDIPGVGGKIDVAVITRDKGFVWIRKKNIIIDEEEISIDNLPNLR
ncbi:MAG: hypothetical protein ACKKMO_01485 [Candidatus Nealsonbacteria bacterium]